MTAELVVDGAESRIGRSLPGVRLALLPGGQESVKLDADAPPAAAEPLGQVALMEARKLPTGVRLGATATDQEIEVIVDITQREDPLELAADAI